MAALTGCSVPLNPSVEHEAAMHAGTADPFKEKACFGFSYQAALLDVLKVGRCWRNGEIRKPST